MTDNTGSTESADNPHADYFRQAAGHFGSAKAAEQPPPAIFRPPAPPPATPAGDSTRSESPPANRVPESPDHSSAPTTEMAEAHEPPTTALRPPPPGPPPPRPPLPDQPLVPPTQPPVPSATVGYPPPYGQPPSQPPAPPADPQPVQPNGPQTVRPTAAPILVAAVGLFVLFIVRLVLVSFPTALLLTFVDAAIVVGYLFFRLRQPVQAQKFEAWTLHTAERALTKMSPVIGEARTTLSTRLANASTPRPVDPNQPAGYGTYPPASRPYGATPYVPPPQVPSYGGPPPYVPSYPGSSYVGSSYVGSSPASPVSTAILLGAFLLGASLIPFAIAFNVASLSSPLQPWFLLMSPIAVLIVVIAVRARPGVNRGLAVAVGAAGAAGYVFATVPSDSWGLSAMLSNAVARGDKSWSEIADLMLWGSRLPLLLTGVFVVAWSLARRRSPAWLLGLIPTGIAIAVAIWYSERGVWQNIGPGWDAGSVWFLQWLLAVGPFAIGCLACWAADVVLTPRTSPPYPDAVPAGR